MQTKKKSDSALGLLGVGAVIVGGLSVFSGVYALVIWLTGDAYFELLATIQSGPLSEVLYAELAAIQKAWSPWTVPLGAASIPTGLILGYQGIQLLSKKTMALASVQWAFGAALALELLRIYPTVAMQIEVMAASQRFAEGFQAAAQGLGGTAGTVLSVSMGVIANSQMVGAVTGGLLSLGKMACVVAALIFIHRRRVAATFA